MGQLRQGISNGSISPEYFYQLIYGIFFFIIFRGGEGDKKKEKALKRLTGHFQSVFFFVFC